MFYEMTKLLLGLLTRRGPIKRITPRVMGKMLFHQVYNLSDMTGR